jgi:integrase
MEPLDLTFNQLKALLSTQLHGTATSSAPNLMSALNAFISERGLPGESLIGSNLRASFRRNVAEHVDALRARGRSSAYIGNRKALLSKWHSLLLAHDHQVAAQHGRESPFQRAIGELHAQAGQSVKALAKAANMPPATLQRWKEGRVPNARSVQWVARLERHFALAGGTLSKLLPTCVRQYVETQPAQPTIAYRVRLAAASKDRYALSGVSPGLRAEWAEYLRYKTRLGQNGLGGAQRGKSAQWSVSPEPVQKRTAALWYAFCDAGYVASASIAWTMLAQYLGWLALSPQEGGKGVAREATMTLAHLADTASVAEYNEWRAARAGTGVAHSGQVRFLQMVTSICHPKTGFLTQNWLRFRDTCPQSTEADWRKQCEQTHGFAKSLMHDLADIIEVSRDSFEPVKDILKLPNPLEAIADAIVRLDADRPVTGGEAEAIWARDRLLMKLVASNPLRAKNLYMMTYAADGGGQLRKVSGKWRIHIDWRLMKNKRGAAYKRDYNMEIRPEVWPDIERYLLHYRPLLAGKGNPYVFVSSASPDIPMYGLRRRFETLSRRYFDNCPGVGPHVMRHIVATSILKANPNDWETAARVLHDRVDTVRAHYAHLVSEDFQSHLHAVMAGPFARM